MRATRLVIGMKHEVIDHQLAASREEIGESLPAIRTIKDVLHEFMGAGMHRITVELPDLSKSIYFLMIRSEYDNQLIRLNNDVN